MPDASAPIVVTSVPDAGSAGLLAREYTAWSMRRPSMVAWSVVVVLGALVSLVGAALLRDRLLAAGIVFWVALGVFIPTMVYRSTRRGLLLAYPPGASVTLAVDDDGIAVVTPRGSQQLRYGALRSLAETDHVVLLRAHGSRAVMMVPRAMFGPGAVERARAGIAASVRPA